MMWVWIILIALVVFSMEELYRYIFCKESSAICELLFEGKGHCEDYYRYHAERNRKMGEIPCQVLTMASARGEQLKGYYYDCGAQGKKIAFVVHGYRSNHVDTGSICYDYYASRGIDVFICDHTAAGDSQGHFIGFDVLESQDCLKWLEVLRQRFGTDIQIILHGFSMGAATVMKMSSHCPENVKFIVEDSGYWCAKSAMAHQVGPLYGPLRLINRLVAGYDWNASVVTEDLKQSRIPMLFVHGQDDKLVPYENGPMLYESYQGEKDCLFPANTRHIETMYTSPDAYWEKLDRFVETYLQ